MTTDYPSISIITPNLNGEKFLEEAILSVVGQGYPNLEYIVMDGGSTDGSLEIINKYKDTISFLASEKDGGLYDALNKGFQRTTGEIMGWINSDDILHRKSLFTLAEIFSLSSDIQWLQGYPTVIDEIGRIVFHRPPVFEKEFFYRKGYKNGSFVQQESTFWRRALWEKAGGFISTEYKYAGDFELWIRFFQHKEQYITNALIGAFRKRKEGQISKVYYENYLEECNVIINKYIPLFHDEEQLLSGICISAENLNLDTNRQVEFNFSTHKFFQKNR